MSAGIERLRTLYSMLAGLPDEKVDLFGWRRSYVGGSFVSGVCDALLLDQGCGTTGCAVGWACAFPEFQKDGLFWGGSGPRYTHQVDEHTLVLSGWPAVSKFFGLTTSQAIALFQQSPSTDITYMGDKEKREAEQIVGDYGYDLRLPDRLRAMRRIRRFLKMQGAISALRHMELRIEEGAAS